MGVMPTQVADLLALKGDAVDNIPGAPGIGEKGARDLIERFGSVEGALERAAEVERKMYRESLQNNVERIQMSKRLATIATDVPVEFSLDAVKAQEFDATLLKAIYKEMEFHSLLKELGPSEDARPRDYRPPRRCRRRFQPACRWRSPSRKPPRASLLSTASASRGMQAKARVGFGRDAGARKAWFEDASAPKIACDVKSALLELGRLGIDARGFDHDVMLYAFLLDADPGGCPLGGTGAAEARFEAGPLAGAARRYHARALEPSGAGGGSARTARSLFEHRTAPDARAGAHGARQAFASIPPSCCVSRN